MTKKLALLLAILLPVLAQAAAATYTATAKGVKGVCASGTCDAPVEAAGLTDGANLADVPYKTVFVTVCADSGQTLSGGGTLTAYSRDGVIALWAAVPRNNIAVTSSARRCQDIEVFDAPIPSGRATWVPTSVTVSGGGVTVYIHFKR